MEQTDTLHNISDPHIRKFAEGAMTSSSREKHRTLEKWAIMGIKRFKRRTLGLCGYVSVKPLDELERILMEIPVS